MGEVDFSKQLIVGRKIQSEQESSTGFVIQN